MTTPTDGPPSGSSGLPPHLDPRGPRRSVPRRDPDYRGAYREAARGPETRATATATAPRPAARTAPPGGGRSRGQRVGRVLSWIALSTAVLILAVAGLGYLALQHFNGQIERINFGVLPGHHTPAKAPHNAENVLLVGSDSRAGKNGVGTGGAHLTSGQRSDTIILAHLFGTSDKAMFVSFPRDAWVEIPSWTDPKTGYFHPAHHDKMNSALAYGGPALLIATVENLTHIRVDHYVSIDFVGFKNMVNALGGVDVCLNQSVDDPKSKLVMTAGRHHINGTTALAFVRDRHSFASGDIERIKHQQQVIGSLVHKVLSSGTLLNPLKLNDFLDAATRSLQVDEGLSINDMKNIALRVRNFNSGHVLFTTVPIADQNGFVAGQSVVLLDQSADDTLFTALRNDQAPAMPGEKKAAAKLTVPPSAIRVRVYNGSGVPGLGRRAFNDLGALGFIATGTPSNRGTGASQTVVYYGPTRADSARTVAAAIPGAVLKLDPGLSRTIEVVVGSTYNGAKPVTVGPSTTPSTASTSAVKIRTASDDPCAG